VDENQTTPAAKLRAGAAPERQPEIELLLACARSHLDGAALARVGELAHRELDWAFLLRQVRRHGLMPRLHGLLDRGCWSGVPEPVRDQLDRDSRTNSARALVLTLELLETLDDLAAHGIRAIPFKGPTLAQQVYGDIARRQFSDLDLLAREADFALARSRFVARGYRPHYGLTPAQEADYLRASGHLPLVRGDGKIMVELHVAVTPKAFGFPLDTACLWDRLATIELLGRTVPVLGTEDLLVILCVHGTKHRWESLGWIGDIAALLGLSGDLDWRRVIQQARQTRSARMLDLGLHLANDLLEAPLPAELRQRIPREPHVRQLASEIRARLFNEDQPVPGIAEEWRFYLRVRERGWDGLRFCLGMVFSPTVADWTRWNVPAPLAFLYHALRATRLVGKYAGRLLARATRGRG